MKPPWLWLPSGLAHSLSPLGLKLTSRFKALQIPKWNPLQWRNLHFFNRLGLAAGVDKDGYNLTDWWKWGPGFVEVGTVVPQPQRANSGRTVDRDIPNRAVWNRMGFPSLGMDAVFRNIDRVFADRPIPLFLNVGKNRATSIEDAPKDYSSVIKKFSQHADAFVLNLSSPNTDGLRELLSKKYLSGFLHSVLSDTRITAPQKPVLIKLSPDLSYDELRFALDTSLEYGIEGWVLTNTTLQRPPGLSFPIGGGVSGRPLSTISKSILTQTLQHLGASRAGKLIVSVGGVMTAQDVYERLHLGADLVQVYSALIFDGPFFFEKVGRAFD